MAPFLYSLLALGSFISSIHCLPAPTAGRNTRPPPPQPTNSGSSSRVLTTQQLQAKQPTLNGLPSNSNVELLYAVLGIGYQNYTCDGSKYVQTLPGSGATALLYDITGLLKVRPDNIPVVAEKCIEEDCSFLTQRLIGNHYFSEAVVPTFNLTRANPPAVFSGVKTAGVPAPSSEDIDWLFLTANPTDGISEGVSEVYRIDTYNGKLPDLTCSDSSPKYQQSYYATQYWFYR